MTTLRQEILKRYYEDVNDYVPQGLFGTITMASQIVLPIVVGFQGVQIDGVKQRLIELARLKGIELTDEQLERGTAYVQWVLAELRKEES